MCGIAGVIGANVDSRIGPMLEAIAHRGRDDSGTYASERFGGGEIRAVLGHRRLSIIDTSPAGHQPFSDPTRRYHITYNGELYNYRDLRETLEAGGEKFATESDTEVLLRSYIVWGSECMLKLNGMFAFAIWDDREKLLFAARDRVGLKPFFFAEAGQTFLFGSEIKAIFASQLIGPEVDPQGLNQFLTFLWPVPPNTMFKGVKQLMPGHTLTWRDGRITTNQYWDLDLSAEEVKGSEREWAARVASTLERVTRMEMVADVPLGAFLSGGVDSTSLVAFMSKYSREPVTAFTTGISAADLEFDIIPDDIVWARKAAAMFSADHRETMLKPDVGELLPKLIRHQEAPVIDMAIPSYLISEQARSTHKVMLSGMGGDEVFAGYPRHMAMQIAGVTDVLPTAVRSPLMRAIDGSLYGGRRGRFTAPLRNAKKFARSAGKAFEERYLGFGTYIGPELRAKIMTGDAVLDAAGFDVYASHREFFERSKGLSPLNRLLYVDFKTFMPALNLDTTDRTSMAANLEVRAPFLNNELVELSARIPSRLKVKGLKRKYILKKALESVLPRDMIWRRKAGFGAPVRSWVRGELKPMIADYLSEKSVMNRGLFNHSAISDMVAANDSGREDYSLQIFQLMGLEIWFREFIDGVRT